MCVKPIQIAREAKNKKEKEEVMIWKMLIYIQMNQMLKLTFVQYYFTISIAFCVPTTLSKAKASYFV